MRQRTDGIKTIADLKLRCRIDDETGCWLWAGAVKATSARVWLPGIGPTSMTAALQVLQHGTRPTSDRMLVPVVCRNPSCGNLAHRRWGTRGELFEIIRPTLPAGHRARVAAGKRRASGLYSPEVRRDIVTSNEPVAVLADRHGMKVSMVYRIRKGERWADGVPGSSVFSMAGGQ